MKVFEHLGFIRAIEKFLKFRKFMRSKLAKRFREVVFIRDLLVEATFLALGILYTVVIRKDVWNILIFPIHLFDLLFELVFH